MWYEWETLEDFELWHQELCEQLGYPITPVNAETGLPDEHAQKVTDYTAPTIVDNKVIAWVEEAYSTELTQTSLRPPAMNLLEM
jgi:hypothetical protein